jgi:predicted enzyme related to lactoylglutathione lyase
VTRLGLRRPPAGLPDAVLSDIARPRPGLGVALWLHADDAQALHDSLAATGTTILSPPADTPFGRTFTFADPDGYAITIHDQP